MTFYLHSRVDPTRTARLVGQFESDLGRRFRAIADAITQKVVGENAFGLTANAGDFEFTRSDQKIGSFMSWIDKQVNAKLLEKTVGKVGTGNQVWSNVYLRSAYQKGISRSAAQLRKGGLTISDRWVNAAFFRPIHADRVGIIYTRSFSELKGITSTMDTRLSRSLASGLVDGLGAKDLAKQLVDEVGLSFNRSRVMARTEIINAHAEGTLNTYEEAGIQGVDVESEFTTAGDNKVCPKCEALEGKVYSIAEARGVIPVHPNCRCAWLPVVNDLPPGVEFR